MSSLGQAQPAVSLGEAQAFVRVETGEEEAVLAGLVRSSSAICEAFLNRIVIVRSFSEDLPARDGWIRLQCGPVRSIELVEAVASDGVATSLPAASYAIDVDSSGDGWIRLIDRGGVSRIRVSGRAGMAAEPNDVPEPIRHGVLRLVGHLYATRDGGGGDPPAAVTALWRPFRRARLA